MMLKYFSILAILFFNLATAIRTEPGIDSPHHRDLKTSMDREDYARAERVLREMRMVSPDAFSLNNYDYLLGRLLEHRGALAEADEQFRVVAARGAALAGYALWHRAAVAREAGNLKEEQRYLRDFLEMNPDHLLRDRAISRLSESYSRTRNYVEVIDTLRGLNGPRRDAMAIIGEAQLALRQIDSAAISFNAVLSIRSMDDSSLRAARGLDQIDALRGTAPSETEALARARIYQFNRFFADARRHWQGLVRAYPQSTARAEALFQLGRGYFLEEKYQDAIRWYEQAHDEFPQTDEGEQGFYYVGHCYQNLNDATRAIARYEEFLKAYPESEYSGYAYLNAIDTLRSTNRPDAALDWAARVQGLQGQFFVITGLFNQAKIRLTQDNYAAALADFSVLKKRSLNFRGLSATTNLPEVTFMRAYCLEKLGRYEEAVNEYLSLDPSRTGAAGYYSMRAGDRLHALSVDPRARGVVESYRSRLVSDARSAPGKGNGVAIRRSAGLALRLVTDIRTREELLAILRKSYAGVRAYSLPALAVTPMGRAQPLARGASPARGNDPQTLASELLFLGLYDEGSLELARTQVSTQTLAFYCARGDCANRTLKYSEPILNSLPDDYQLELLPRQWAEIFYPYPHRDDLNRFARSRRVDPRFLLSIARQESAYNPGATSAAAARGMMQFIAPTANQIAARLNLRNFEQNDLYRAETSINFGSQYLKNLFDEFDSPQAVAAAYNGSEDSVRRWIARSGSRDVDRLVIEVAKRETKDYVYKVMNHYAAYQILYPDR